MNVLGIDIGGSGIKGAPVDLATGNLVEERHRIPTPDPSVPPAVADVVGQLVNHFDWRGPVGCTFPAVVRHGVVYTAANVDDSWIGTDAVTLFEQVTTCPVRILNDADAAGLAEMEFGVGKHRQGVVIMLTFGTGIGTAIFVDGQLLPNTELGHLIVQGQDAEHRAAARIRKEEGLSWRGWAERVNEYLQYMESLFSPDLFIIGGGVSKKQHKFLQYLEVQAEIVPAQLLNEAGIVGAALAAAIWSISRDDAIHARFCCPRRLPMPAVERPPINQQITFLYTTNLSRAADFYQRVFRLPLVLDQGACRIYRVNNSAFLGICQRDRTPPATDGVIFTFVTHDVDGWYRFLTDQGVVFDKTPVYNPDYNIYHCFLRDPDGYLLEIQTFRDPAWPSV